MFKKIIKCYRPSCKCYYEFKHFNKKNENYVKCFNKSRQKYLNSLKDFDEINCKPSIKNPPMPYL